MKKIVLFGGSFNPIHNAHLAIANELINKKIIDEVWFIPCGNHPFDKNLASGRDRINMLNLAIKDNSKFKIIEIEINSNKKSYTSETIKQLKTKFSHEFYFIIGADNLSNLNKWHDFEYLKKDIKFILVKRPGFELSNNFGINISYILEMENTISSTNIRKNIKKDLSIENLVQEKIENYIKQEGLYK